MIVLLLEAFWGVFCKAHFTRFGWQTILCSDHTCLSLHQWACDLQSHIYKEACVFLHLIMSMVIVCRFKVTLQVNRRFADVETTYQGSQVQSWGKQWGRGICQITGRLSLPYCISSAWVKGNSEHQGVCFLHTSTCWYWYRFLVVAILRGVGWQKSDGR